MTKASKKTIRKTDVPLSVTEPWKNFVHRVKRNSDIHDHQLSEILDLAWSTYEGASSWSDEKTSDKRHRASAKFIERHLNKATKKLRAIQDWRGLQGALNEERLGLTNIGQFLDCLEAVATFLHTVGHSERKRGPAPKSEALYIWVSALGNYWADVTGKRITQGYITDGAQVQNRGGFAHFIYSVVEYCEPSQLPALRKVLERYVAERRNATSPIKRKPSKPGKA